MLCTSLHGIKMIRPGGLYPEEQLLDNYFEVDVDLFQHAELNKPFPFADYSVVYDLVSEAFKGQITSLEELLQNIAGSIKNTFPQLEKMKISVKKLNPPLGGEVASAGVSWEG